MLEVLLKEYRQHRMARFAVWIVAYGAALWLVHRFTGGASSVLWFLFWITFLPVVGYYLVRLAGYVRRHLLWHLRRRLILTYFFVAVVPIALIFLLIYFATVILYGQLASFLVLSNFRARAATLGQLGTVLTHHAAYSSQGSAAATVNDLEDFLVSELGQESAEYPGLEATFRLGPATRAIRLEGRQAVKPVSAPTWLKGQDFTGIALDDDRLALRIARRARTRNGDLLVTLSEPFSPQLLNQIGEGLGPVLAFEPGKAGGPSSASSGRGAFTVSFGSAGQTIRMSNASGQMVDAEAISSSSLGVPPPSGRFDYMVHNMASLQPYVWNSTQGQSTPELGFCYVTSRIVTLNRHLISTLGELSSIYWTVFAAIGIVFLLIEIVSIVISVRLTRSITTTVDKLNEATERVKAGDFSHRINLPARDQLTALGEAFDGMTASVERLLRESLEKTKLEGELEIAREVQDQLFPQSTPEVAGLRLYGLCKPARTVSGDYYDFLRLGEGRVALVVGDISGKGISAALLMATLQSALHAQFYNGHGQASSGAASAWPARTAEVVGRLNRQIYASTPREKYVTLFYGIYDAATRKLTYTNAGHLPPVLFRQDRMERLEGGGTVVGLFPSVRYEQAETRLEPGDLLLAFTDGMTEPENSYGEEFGETRLLDVARHTRGAPPEVLMDEIYRTVSDWTGSSELQDDMTLVVAQALS